MDKKEIKRPTRMNMSVMRQIFAENSIKSDGSFFMSKDFGISCGSNQMFHAIIKSRVGSPMIIEDYRMGFVVKGEINVTINLIDYKITPGTMVYLGRGSIGYINSISEDIEVRGFVFSADLMTKILGDRKPEIIDGTVMNFVAPALAEDKTFIENISTAAWSLVKSVHYSEASMIGIFSSVINYYNNIYLEHNEALQNNSANNRNREVFNNFLSLVNQNVTYERSVSFYADKLCLSQRYLSTIITEQSGKSAKHWIDEATIARAKVLLTHTNKSVSQIAYELHFPNDSFFCKYFRRLTGLSPSKYREG